MNDTASYADLGDVRDQFEPFQHTITYIDAHAGHLGSLIDKTEEIVDTVDWALVYGPNYVDQGLLQAVASGVLKGIGAILEVGMNGEEIDWDRTFLAQESLCEWRQNFWRLSNQWLLGWTGVRAEDSSVLGLFVDEFKISFRLVMFVLKLTWLLFFGSFRLDCTPLDDEHVEEEEGLVLVPAPVLIPEDVEDEEMEVIPMPASHIDEDLEEEESDDPEILAPSECEGLYDELATLVGLHPGVLCPDEMVSAAKARLEVEPWDADVRWDLAKCYAEGDAYPLAIKEYEDILHQRPEYHEARKQLIYCLASLRQWDGAEQETRYLLMIQRIAEEAQEIFDLVEEIRLDCDEEQENDGDEV
ncbi:MAG: tetratricopeptide repeat protein [Chloroflexi bacterium]|nr:tetratricopeptide repeat protein [Chloroflexota bacterium]